MRFYRIGEKIVSREKLLEAISGILEDRERGATQLQAAMEHDVQRSFVSFLESLGEVRRGVRVALIGFPIANVEGVRSVADRHGVEFTMLLSQMEREAMESGSAAELFNQVLETLARLKDFDVLVLLASDWRVEVIEKILGREVIGLSLGPSPIREDVEIDVEELSALLSSITSRPLKKRDLIKQAFEGAGRWTPSKRSSASR